MVGEETIQREVLHACYAAYSLLYSSAHLNVNNANHHGQF